MSDNNSNGQSSVSDAEQVDPETTEIWMSLKSGWIQKTLIQKI